jgi:CHAT domain-containing protein
LAQAGHRRAPLGDNARLLAVADPNNNLPFASEEVAAIAAQFTAPQTLHHEEARQDVLLAVDSPHIFHFAGHGAYDWEDVQQSGLLCTDSLLTLHTMQRRLPLQNTQLVVLSACETGLTDLTHAADEYIGLPFAFLSAGVAGIVTSLWAVNDLSTMLLMEQFYHHLRQNQDAPLALHQAQLWLRRVTAGELAKRFGEERLQIKANRLTLAEASSYWLRFAAEEPESKPFAHPHFWAAFTFTGA